VVVLFERRRPRAAFGAGDDARVGELDLDGPAVAVDAARLPDGENRCGSSATRSRWSRTTPWVVNCRGITSSGSVSSAANSVVVSNSFVNSRMRSSTSRRNSLGSSSVGS
jgi:hypothetical protein